MSCVLTFKVESPTVGVVVGYELVLILIVAAEGFANLLLKLVRIYGAERVTGLFLDRI
jgi:hypothetical protein